MLCFVSSFIVYILSLISLSHESEKNDFWLCPWCFFAPMSPRMWIQLLFSHECEQNLPPVSAKAIPLNFSLFFCWFSYQPQLHLLMYFFGCVCMSLVPRYLPRACCVWVRFLTWSIGIPCLYLNIPNEITKVLQQISLCFINLISSFPINIELPPYLSKLYFCYWKQFVWSSPGVTWGK